jgi:hypothetical protein
LTIDEKGDPFRITHHHHAFRKTILANSNHAGGWRITLVLSFYIG